LEVAVVSVVLLLALLVVRVRWLWSTLECSPELVALLGSVVAVQMPQALLFFEQQNRGATPPGNRKHILTEETKVNLQRGGTYTLPNQRLGN
jgi:hypothetical protein